MALPGSRENYYLGAILGVVTFAAIFLVGVFSGVGLGLLFIRGLLYGLLVTVLGSAAGFVFERLSPGLWDEAPSESGQEDGALAEGAGLSGGQEGPRPSFDYTIKDDPPAKGPLPDGSEDIGLGGGSSATGMGEGESRVVGNIRIIGDKQFPNDPEDYAKAIRTMMNRDEE